LEFFGERGMGGDGGFLKWGEKIIWVIDVIA
jgi:hypothetical protein